MDTAYLRIITIDIATDATYNYPKMKKLVSIVIPTFNEEESLPELIKQIEKNTNSLKIYNFEYVFVENASSDNSLKILLAARKTNKKIKIIQLAKNVGCDGAIVAGLHFIKGNAAIIMMADLQDPPQVIPKFISYWEKGYDVVYAVIKRKEQMRFTRRIGTYLFYKFMSLLTDNMLPENVSDFRLIDKRVYAEIISLPEHNKFFRGLVSWLGFKQIGITVNRPRRFAGYSKASFGLMFSLAISSIYSFSYKPLRLSWIFFLITGVLGFYYFFTDARSLGIISFFVSAIFLVLGIISEYLIKILDEVRDRPQFSLKETFGI